MKFNFSLRTRQTDERYTRIRTLTTDKQEELFGALLPASLYETFYDAPAEELAALRKLIRESDAVFVARLAVYIREQLQMRTLSFILAAELCGVCKDKELTGRLAGRIVQHAEEIPRWLDHYAHVQGKGQGKALRLSTVMRRELAKHMNRLDTYQFVRLTKAQQARLRFAFTLIRPRAEGKAQQELFRRILQDKLPARNAWMSEYEAMRQQNYDSRELRQAALRDKWKEGISGFRMGYKALLENLPQILKAGVSGKALKLAAEYLSNAAAVEGSRLSPWQLAEAYQAMEDLQQGGAQTLREALETAVKHSAYHLTGIDEGERVVVAMDISPSMLQPIREGGLVKRYDVAPLLSMLLRHRGVNVATGIIGNTWKHCRLTGNQPMAELVRLQKSAGEAGYAIHAHLVLRDLLRRGEVIDKVMIFTDCPLWNQRSFNQDAADDLAALWGAYRQLAPNAKLYLFDLAGYGQRRVERPAAAVYLVAGWNDKVFQVAKALEGASVTMEEIEGFNL